MFWVKLKGFSLCFPKNLHSGQDFYATAGLSDPAKYQLCELTQVVPLYTSKSAWYGDFLAPDIFPPKSLFQISLLKVFARVQDLFAIRHIFAQNCSAGQGNTPDGLESHRTIS